MPTEYLVRAPQHPFTDSFTNDVLASSPELRPQQPVVRHVVSHVRSELCDRASRPEIGKERPVEVKDACLSGVLVALVHESRDPEAHKGVRVAQGRCLPGAPIDPNVRD